jgi:hypothetical protein
MFEKRVLRRIFGPKRNEVTGSWRKLHNEELHNFCSTMYCYDDQIGEDEMSWECSARRTDEKCVQNFGWKA